MTANSSKKNSESNGNCPVGGVSIIVLNRNGGAHLKNLFDSFTAYNSYGSYEFIVVDHASTDNSLDVLKGFERKLCIKVIKESTNKSFSHSNNNAVSFSGYENLLFVNNDIIIKNDVIPGVLRYLGNPTIGVVGINLYYPGEGMECGSVQHAGIRFKEDRRHQFYRPYNLKNAGMVEIEHFPAVTGAFLACRKSDFIKVGGFCESYFYGYEDVDLCLGIAKYTKKKCLIDHNLYAIHDESATQKKDAYHSIKRRRLHNISTLISRYGYALKRGIWLDMYNKRRFWAESRPVIGFVVTNVMPHAREYVRVSKLSETLVREWGYECRFIQEGGRRDWYDAAGLDVLVTMESSYDLTNLKNAKPSLIKMAWIQDFTEGWTCKAWFDNYDLYLCGSQETADSVRKMAGYEVHALNWASVYNSSAECGLGAWYSRGVELGSKSLTLGEACIGDAERFTRILGVYRSIKYRISIKIAVRGYKGINNWADFHYASEMKKQLKRLGHSVRIDIFPEWYRDESFGDDVVIVLRGFSAYKPSGSHINLMWNISHYENVTSDEYAGYDHVFISSEDWVRKPRKTMGSPVSVLFKEAAFPGRKFLYDGLLGDLKSMARSMKKLGERSGVIALPPDFFSRPILEILKVVEECNARKCIN